MNRRIGVFLALAFGVSWGAVLVFSIAGLPYRGGAAAALTVFVGFPVGIAALAVKGAIYGEPVRDDFGFRLRPTRWFLAAWMVPLVVALLSLTVASLLPDVRVDLTTESYLARLRASETAERMAEIEAGIRSSILHPLVRELLFGTIAGTTFGAGIALLQELGWRGFLHHELKLAPIPKALVIGLAWGVWRAPLTAMGSGETPWFVSCLLMGSWCVAASLVLGLLRDRSGSVVATAIAHGSLVGTAGVATGATGASALWVGQHGVAGNAAMWLLALAAAVLTEWERRRRVAP
jgi:membrane protease YdiL (CAAX protease family)